MPKSKQRKGRGKGIARSGHAHRWIMASSHPFGARTTYRCESCPETMVVPRRLML